MKKRKRIYANIVADLADPRLYEVLAIILAVLALVGVTIYAIDIGNAILEYREYLPPADRYQTGFSLEQLYFRIKWQVTGVAQFLAMTIIAIAVCMAFARHLRGYR